MWRILCLHTVHCSLCVYIARVIFSYSYLSYSWKSAINRKVFLWNSCSNMNLGSVAIPVCFFGIRIQLSFWFGSEARSESKLEWQALGRSNNSNLYLIFSYFNMICYLSNYYRSAQPTLFLMLNHSIRFGSGSGSKEKKS